MSTKIENSETQVIQLASCPHFCRMGEIFASISTPVPRVCTPYDNVYCLCSCYLAPLEPDPKSLYSCSEYDILFCNY
jgi:hypothetical protein